MDKLIKRGVIVLVPLAVARIFLGYEIVKQKAITELGELWQRTDIPYIFPMDIYALVQSSVALDFFITIIMVIVLSAWLIYFVKKKDKLTFKYILLILLISIVVETGFYFYTRSRLPRDYIVFWGIGLNFVKSGLVYALIITGIYHLINYAKRKKRV